MKKRDILQQSDASLVEYFRGEADFVAPINGVRGERQVAEVAHIMQLATDAPLHHWGEINKLHRPDVER